MKLEDLEKHLDKPDLLKYPITLPLKALDKERWTRLRLALKQAGNQYQLVPLARAALLELMQMLEEKMCLTPIVPRTEGLPTGINPLGDSMGSE